MRHLFFPAIIFLFLLSIVPAQSNEFSGIVVDILDATTLDVRIGDEILRVQLANLSSPSISTPEGLDARNFTSAVLLNRSIWLDLDGNPSKGADVVQAVVYLFGPDGRPVRPSFNEIFKDSGFLGSGNSLIYDPMTQFVKEVWLPETLKEASESLEAEIPADDQITDRLDKIPEIKIPEIKIPEMPHLENPPGK